MEYSLLIEAYANRMEARDRTAAFAGWMSAILSRRKRLGSFSSIWKRHDHKARPLPPDEAEKELARHRALIEKLAPETLSKE